MLDADKILDAIIEKEEEELLSRLLTVWWRGFKDNLSLDMGNPVVRHRVKVFRKRLAEIGGGDTLAGAKAVASGLTGYDDYDELWLAWWLRGGRYG